MAIEPAHLLSSWKMGLSGHDKLRCSKHNDHSTNTMAHTPGSGLSILHTVPFSPFHNALHKAALVFTEEETT